MIIHRKAHCFKHFLLHNPDKITVSGKKTSSDVPLLHDQTLSCLEIKFDVDEMDNIDGNNLPLSLSSKIPKNETKQDIGNSSLAELAPNYPSSSGVITVKEEVMDIKGKLN